MARITLELADTDKRKLATEAEKLGIGNISGLIRLLIKQFLINPNIDFSSIRQYNNEKE